MKNMERQIIEIDNKWYDIIATYYNEEYDKDYVIYTDGIKDKDGKLNVYYGSYVLTNNKFDVKSIENEKEEKIIISVLKTIMEEVNK